MRRWAQVAEQRQRMTVLVTALGLLTLVVAVQLAVVVCNLPLSEENRALLQSTQTAVLALTGPIVGYYFGRRV